MSHLSTIKTQIKDLTALTNALHEMGYSLGGAGTVTYRGQSANAEAIVKLPNGTEIGFTREQDGTYGLTAEWNHDLQGQFVGRLSQLYGVHKAILEATLEGYMVERETDVNGMIRLTLSRA